MIQKINVGIAGLGFGGEFIPIYQNHSLCGEVAICTRNPDALKEIGDRFGIPNELRYTDYYEMIKNTDLDAIHIVTPIEEHYPQTMAALKEGKHTACTVPMATSINELFDIIEAKSKAEKVYMMMETALYTREYLYVSKQIRDGNFGRIQFIRGAHMQNMAMEGWKDYWQGFPPFHYGTHAISPLLYLLDTRAESVICHGSGRLNEARSAKYGSPFAVETATFKMAGSDVVAEATRCLFETVRQVVESFDVYGDKMSFEWEQFLDDGHVIFENIDDARKIHAPDSSNLLPESIRRFAAREFVEDPNQPSFIQGAGHGGSHPFLADEFLKAIAENRESPIDAVRSADITGAGICAHQSAMSGGARIIIPDFSKGR